MQSRLGHFLFSKDGLYLSSYCYDIGRDGGNDRASVTTVGKRAEYFLMGLMTSAETMLGFFWKIAQSWAVPYITFFVNVAPSHIADNSAACGWNMTCAKIPAFAEYIRAVLSYWISNGNAIWAVTGLLYAHDR